MAETQPFWMQADCYTYDELRTMGNNVCGEGVVEKQAGSLLVASTGAADHSVTVAAGYAWVEADGPNVEGFYKIRNDATTATVQLTAGSGGDPRVDTIVATVRDTESSGVDDDWILTVVDGTPNAGAALTDAGIALSAAAVPVNTIVLAYVLVAGADTLTTTISGANILDARSNYEQCGPQPWVSLEASAATSIADANVATQVTLATLVNRDRGYFSVSGSTITVLQTGLYDISGMAGFSGITSAGTNRFCLILKNNTNLPNAGPDGLIVAEGRIGHDATESPSSITWTPRRGQVQLAANDTIKMCLAQDTGTGAKSSFHSSAFLAHLTVRKVG